MLASDWRSLTVAGWSQHWTCNPNGSGQAYVRVSRTRATGRLVTVARLIAEAGEGRIVRYLDGDRTNLRRDNLWLDDGKAKRRDVDTPRTRSSMSGARTR